MSKPKVTVPHPVGTLPALPEIVGRFSLINPGGKPPSCTVILRNSTLPEREATIVAAGAHFFYGDAKGATLGDYMAGPVPVELGPSATAPFRFTDPRRNVTNAIVAVRVRFGDKDAKNVSEFDYSLAINAPVMTSNPPIRAYFAEVRVEFCVRPEVRFSAQTAQDWYHLRLVAQD